MSGLDGKVAIVTGAAGAIGAAVAQRLVADGAHVVMLDRAAEQLAAAAAPLDASATTLVLDLTDPAAVETGVADLVERFGHIDVLVNNAGILSNNKLADAGYEEWRRIFAVNVDGVMNTVFPAIDCMRTHPLVGGGRGQIAIMASLAGFHGYPGAAAYAASKNAVRAWGESLRGELHHEGIRISVICPGFVATPMTEGATFPQPFKLSAERAAEIVKRGLARDRSRIAFPWPTYFAAWLGIALPERVIDPLMRPMPKKR